MYKIDNLLKDFITIVILSTICFVIDWSMLFYDHRIVLGVVVGSIGYKPIRKLFGL